MKNKNNGSPVLYADTNALTRGKKNLLQSPSQTSFCAVDTSYVKKV